MRPEEEQPSKEQRHRGAGPVPVDAVDALSHRLAQLRDEQWVKQALEAALRDMANGPVEVTAFQIEYCKIRPKRDINVALNLTLRMRWSGGPIQRRVSCTLWSGVETARRQYADETLRLEPDFLDASRGLDGFERLMTLVPDVAMVVRLFPADRTLGGLVPAIVASRMLPLLDNFLPACREEGWRARDLQYVVVRYKPEHLCTLRYLVHMSRPFRLEARTQEVYGKVYQDEHWRSAFDVLEACWTAASRSDGAWRVARPIVAMPAWRFSLQEAVSGRGFRQVIADLVHDDASEADLAQAEEHLRALARAIRSFQRAPVRLGPRRDFGWLLARPLRNLPYLQQSEPALAEDLTRLTQELMRLEQTIPDAALGLAHCDLVHDKVLIDGHHIGIIDLDRAGQAEPPYDVACFLTHLCSFGTRHPQWRQQVQRLSETLRAAYLGLAPEVSRERLALYEALDLASYVLRNFPRQIHRATWLPWAQGQTEAAWSRLGQAARHGRLPS